MNCKLTSYFKVFWKEMNEGFIKRMLNCFSQNTDLWDYEEAIAESELWFIQLI